MGFNLGFKGLNSFNKNIAYKAAESNSQCEVQVSSNKLIDYKNGEDTLQRSLYLDTHTL